ncbi:MAG: PLP-dependent aminotransferase family protein [Clostridia bacterium]|nr:PLP-dependent aminotransferase family protein [Clostridia bacterium]
MKYSINVSEGKFAYLQIYEQIKKDIVSGAIRFGSKLPSKRLMCEETGVSVITVEHAYSILCDEGYIEAKERSGYFVIYKESDFLSTIDSHSEPQILKTSRKKAECDFPVSVLQKAVRKVLIDKDSEILKRSPNQGLEELRGAIAEYLFRSNGIRVSKEQIIVGAGAEYLYSLILQLLGKNRIFALENPSYEKIRKVYSANNVKTDMLNLGGNGIKTTELNRTAATVLHITPFNSFPSGITATVSKRQEYLRWAENRKGFIVEDNYAAELTVSKKNEDTVFSLSENGRVIYLNTFSETIAPSMRIGYMVLPENLLKDFTEKLGFYSCTVPVLDQYVLCELIESGSFERHINRVRRAKRKAD